ncbi:MAG: CAP domain-containing protein [Linnemannia gamsii]|nr:MAG: CAP domain-containing protein [Linnemannia gamsii]
MLLDHFTKLVWKNTTQVACAMVDCGAGSILPEATTFIVCRYTPAGNISGQFPQNVGHHV